VTDLKRLLALALLSAGALRADDADVNRVAGMLAGHFVSEGAFVGGGGTRLIAELVPKSRFGFGAPVLYVEEARADSPDRPYRQRFLRIEDAGASRALLKVFEPKDRIAVAGKWREPADLALFGERDVVERKGCDIVLVKDGDAYAGETKGNGCPSPLAGGRTMTERLRVGTGDLEIAEAGFDAAGKRVWGAEKPLLFKREVGGVPAPSVEKGEPAKAQPLAPSVRAVRTPAAPVPAPETGGGPFELAVRGPGVKKTLTFGDLSRLPQAERRLEKKRYKGPALREVLKAAGLDVSDARRASYAASAVLVFGADDDGAVFALDEAWLESAPIVALEADGHALTSAEGALRMVASASPARSIRKLVVIEVRDLAAGVPLAR
jgi:hypothetical protein